MIRLAVGLSICLAAWRFVLRRGVGARPVRATPALALALDVAPVLAGFAAATAATGRPLLSALLVVTLAAGLSLADRVKRAVLDEPVVFADRAELLEVMRHPRLYLPFAGSSAAIAGVAVLAAGAVLLLAWAEPPVWRRSWPGAAIEAAVSLMAAASCFAVPASWPALLRRLAGLYERRLAPSRDPARDAVALGPLAALVVHATLAAAARPARQAAAAAGPALSGFPVDAGPVVLVQAESFFDPARLHPGLAGLLPHFAALAAAGRHGRLQVPAWGANTVRSEFAALTGLAEQALGLDRFNPYEAFAGAGGPLPSLARAARLAGYRTIFVHPFDLAFYGRRHVLPRLGFDELIGAGAFADALRRGAYVSDAAVARAVAELLRRHGPRVFVFVATMEAHGPWSDAADPAPMVILPPALRDWPEARSLARWLWRLQGTDSLLPILTEALEVQGGLLGFYGDHQPSLPGAFAAAGFTDRRTDYLLWRAGDRSATGAVDLAAHDLAGALCDALRRPRVLAAEPIH